SSHQPIARDEWREALGDGKRVADWTAFFERELAESPWRDVLNVWALRLAPGLVTAATHGVIRTGHAVRSLSHGETPRRLQELAEGLAYWAARYQVLPGTPSANGSLAPSEAIECVDLVPIERQEARGLITAGLRQLSDFAPFASTIDLVDTSGDASRFISDLTETFAAVYLANAGGGRVIHFVHAVTGPSALRLLAPHLAPETTRSAMRYAWQAAVGLYAAFGRNPAAAPAEPPAGYADDLIDRAIATGDEHAIKFTEACLREHALNPKPVYLIAAQDASTRLSRN
ncbi:MAG: questin oxidase family protein, partial [Dehalococcoidia bacterium]